MTEVGAGDDEVRRLTAAGPEGGEAGPPAATPVPAGHEPRVDAPFDEPAACAAVTALYRAILCREADPRGLAIHVDLLRNGAGVLEVVNALASSSEFAARCRAAGLAHPAAGPAAVRFEFVLVTVDPLPKVARGTPTRSPGSRSWSSPPSPGWPRVSPPTCEAAAGTAGSEPASRSHPEPARHETPDRPVDDAAEAWSDARGGAGTTRAGRRTAGPRSGEPAEDGAFPVKTLLADAVFAAAPFAHAAADGGVTATCEATPDVLWALVDFHRPSEAIMPPIASSTREGEGLGATKTNVLAGDGGEIDLLLVCDAPEDRAFDDTIADGPLPVAGYVGEVRVTDAGDGRARLSWQGTYDAAGVPEERADEILGGFCAAIAEKIGETFPRIH